VTARAPSHAAGAERAATPAAAEAGPLARRASRVPWLARVAARLRALAGRLFRAARSRRSTRDARHDR
jgi:hypothetical protein